MAQSFYNLTVADTRRVSPSMHQITLEGDDLLDFPRDQDGAYFKLILEPGTAGKKALMRTYTIRRQREGAIDIQFALHGDHAAGAATSWALAAKAGDAMTIRGPGSLKPFPGACDFHLIAGDMSALPVISANLERMDRDAKGVAVLEIQHEEDAVAIDAPKGVAIQWLVNPKPGLHPDLLGDALRPAQRPKGEIAGWVASEFEAMKKVRAFLREEVGVAPRNLYASSYWKLGLNETEHKVIKGQDQGAQPVKGLLSRFSLARG